MGSSLLRASSDDEDARMVAASSVAYVDWYGKECRQTWTTPRDFFDGLHAEYGFTMDGAAYPETALLPRFSSAAEPREWNGERVFCNPPWSLIKPFVDMAASAELAVLLVPARTNARWFHRAIAYGADVRFFLGRPRFDNGPVGQKGHDSPVDCLLLVFDNTANVGRKPDFATENASDSSVRGES